MPTIKINDIDLFYEVKGAGEPVIFISGFASDHTMWLEIADKLAAQYKIILFDNRGVGRSSAPDYPYSVAMFANDVVALCDALQIKRAHFIGSSMGGLITQYLAYHFPERVNSIVLSSTFAKVDYKFSLFVKGRIALMQNQQNTTQALAEIFLPWAFSSDYLEKHGDELIKLIVNNPYPMTASSFKNQYVAVLGFDSNEWLNRIDMPCLVLAGEKDIIDPLELTRQLAKKIPNAAFYSFKNAAHVPHIEQPEEFTRVVKEFLQSLSL